VDDVLGRRERASEHARPRNDACLALAKGIGRRREMGAWLPNLQRHVRVWNAVCVRERDRGLLTSNFENARLLLVEAGYDGTPVVLMHSTDLYNLTNWRRLPSS
jgi:hypothetical protein